MIAIVLACFHAAPPASAPAEWTALVRQLDDDEKRHAAVAALRRLGEEAGPFLRREARRPGLDVDARLALISVAAEIRARHWGPVRAMGRGAALEIVPFRWMHSFQPAGFTPDGKTAIVAAWGPLTVNLADGKVTGPPEPRRRRELFARLDVSGDGKRALAGDTEDPVFRLVELPGLRAVVEFRGHEGAVTALRLSPDGNLAASAGADGTVRLWDARTGKHLRDAQGKGPHAACLAFSPDGKELVFDSDSGLRVHSVATGKRLRTLPAAGRAASIAHLPGGRLLVGHHTGSAIVLRASDGKELLRLRHGVSLSQAASSPEGRRAATVGSNSPAVKVWCLDTGRLLKTLDGHVGMPAGACFSPDGTRLLTGDSVSTLRLWKVGRH